MAGLSNVVQVAAGGLFSLALLTDGTVMAWGANNRGQPGDGTTFTRGVPRLIPGLTGVTSIAAGTDHGLALLGDGTVAAWGGNREGQLGDGTTTQRLTPGPVLGLTDATAVAAGNHHSLATVAGLQVRAWGRNDSGQLGDNTTIRRTLPVAVKLSNGNNLGGVVQIDAGLDSSVALSNQQVYGSIYSWGSQRSGQLGNGATTGNQPYAARLANSSEFRKISVGTSHMVAIGYEGYVYAWGANGLGQVGINQQTAVVSTPQQVVGRLCCQPAQAIAAAGDASLALSAL